MIILVHTGAGNYSKSKEKIRQFKNLISETCISTFKELTKGMSATEAIVHAVSMLEDNEITNAGKGSNLNIAGNIECDASIMDDQGQFGAVGALLNCLNPIQVAHKILALQRLQDTPQLVPPLLLVGEGAVRFAIKYNVGNPHRSLLTEKSLSTYHYYKNLIQRTNSEKLRIEVPLDTVGAIAIDSNNNMSSGCSSGGIILKNEGRIGQAAIYGAGCYVYMDSSMSLKISCCSTGVGEFIIKTNLCKWLSHIIVEQFSKNPSTSPPLNEVFNEWLNSLTTTDNNTFSQFGLLVIIEYGSIKEIWVLFNTESLCFGFLADSFQLPKIYHLIKDVSRKYCIHCYSFT